MTLTIHRTGPAAVQDMGRPNRLAEGLSRGGAADRLALLEAAALLGLRTPVAGIEMAMMGCEVTTDTATRIALTGATMAALTIYDMTKALSRDVVVREVRLMEKSGGKDDFRRED